MATSVVVVIDIDVPLLSIVHISELPGKSTLHHRRRHLHVAMLFLEIWTTPPYCLLSPSFFVSYFLLAPSRSF
jgi:hypothetical protein